MATHPLIPAFRTLASNPAVAARQLAGAGVPVFAGVPGGKQPLPGSRGFLDATTEPSHIDNWWRRVPKANLAIPTGRASGLVVVDVDVHGVNGFDALPSCPRCWSAAEAVGGGAYPVGRHAPLLPSQPEYRAAVVAGRQGWD
jgi:hypothetical protein